MHQFLSRLAIFRPRLTAGYKRRQTQINFLPINRCISETIHGNNNNTNANVYGAVIMAEPLREFTRFI